MEGIKPTVLEWGILGLGESYNSTVAKACLLCTGSG